MSSHKRLVCSIQVVRQDFLCENHGSIFLLRPVSLASFDWIESHLPSDRITLGNAVAVDHRCIWAILACGEDSRILRGPYCPRTRLHRLLQWHGEPNGAALIIRLGQAISNGIKGSSGERKFPIDDPAWYPFKRDTVIELRALQSRLRTNPNLTGCRRFPSPAELQEIIDQEIHRSPADFSRLLENSRAFQAFVAHDAKSARSLFLGSSGQRSFAMS